MPWPGSSAAAAEQLLKRREFLEEERADQVLYRNTFGTQRPGGALRNAFNLKLKNPANTNVLCWGNRLLALWEVRVPFQSSVFLAGCALILRLLWSPSALYCAMNWQSLRMLSSEGDAASTSLRQRSSCCEVRCTCCEQAGAPYELHPYTLDTRPNPVTLDGFVLDGLAPSSTGVSAPSASDAE